MAISRRSYKGAPVSNTLGGSGLAANATTITIASALSGWPTGSEPFFVVVDPGTAKEEKICVIYTSTTSLTVVDPAVTSSWSASVNGRGADDTTDRAHDAGAVIYPVFTAREANDANRLVATYANQGGIVYQGASNPAQLAIGTAGHVLKVNSGATAPEWGQIGTTGIADSAITSGKIEDGAIVNADINASAAIALSKLATGALPTAITVASANLVDLTVDTADIKDDAVTAAKILAGAVGVSELASAVAGDGLAGGAGTALSVNVDSSTIEINTDSLRVKDLGITTAKIAAGAVTSAKLASNVPLGLIAKDTKTTDSSTITSGSVNCLASAVSLTPTVGRAYRISTSAFAQFTYNDVNTDTWWVAIVDGSNNVLQYLSAPPPSFPSGINSFADSYLFIPSTSTAVSFNIRITITAGTPSLLFKGGTGYQNYLVIEDIGAA